MPIPFWKRPGFWEWVEIVAAIAALLSAILAVVDKLSGAIWGSFFGALILTAKFIQKRLEKKERTEREQLARRLMKAVLDAMRREYFARVEDENLHQHRVTLLIFKDADASLRLEKRLEIYARSGVFESSTCVLRVSENELGQCEGVAGRVWFRGAPQTVELPEWASDDASQHAYADDGYLGIDRAAGLNVKSRALSGVPVRAFGRKWGVLILDSLVPGYVSGQPHKVGIVNWYAALITCMIETGAEL